MMEEPPTARHLVVPTGASIQRIETSPSGQDKTSLGVGESKSEGTGLVIPISLDNRKYRVGLLSESPIDGFWQTNEGALMVGKVFSDEVMVWDPKRAMSVSVGSSFSKSMHFRLERLVVNRNNLFLLLRKN